MRLGWILVGLVAASGAASATEWVVEDGQRVPGTVPDAFILPNGSVRLFFCSPGGLQYADSLAGVAFSTPSGDILPANAPKGCDPTLVRLQDGTHRLYYKTSNGAGGPDQAQHRIHSATSAEGGKPFSYDRLVIDQRADGHYVSVPDAVVLPDGKVRVFYVSEERVKSSLSTDATGRVFTEEPDARMRNAVDPDVTKVGDVWVMTFSAKNEVFKGNVPAPQWLAYATSHDGFTFYFAEDILRGQFMYLDPTLVMLPDGRARIYYWQSNEDFTRSIVSKEAFRPVVTMVPDTSSSPGVPPGGDDPDEKKGIPTVGIVPLGLTIWAVLARRRSL